MEEDPCKHTSSNSLSTTVSQSISQLFRLRSGTRSIAPSKIRCLERSTVTWYPASRSALQVVGVTTNDFNNCQKKNHPVIGVWIGKNGQKAHQVLTGRPRFSGLGFSAQPDLSSRHLGRQLMLFVECTKKSGILLQQT